MARHRNSRRHLSRLGGNDTGWSGRRRRRVDNKAKGALRQGDTPAKCQAIGHAVRIIDEGLKSALDLRGGGKLAHDLSDLYAYVCMRLTQGNRHNDEAALDECLTLMAPLREAWHAIGVQVDRTASN